MNVLVYTGPGTAKGPVDNTALTLKSLLSTYYDVIPVDANTLLSDSWQATTALLVIPGGRDLPYVEHLEPKGTQIVGDYVRNGGAYLGICAGAYFASSRVEFEVGREGYEVVGPRALGFWPGPAKGSVAPGFVYGTEKGSRAVRIEVDQSGWTTNPNFPQTILDTYVNGGPFFELEDASLTKHSPKVLAHYASHDGQSSRPAIVGCTVGSGRVILSGAHIEYRADTLPGPSCDPDLTRVLSSLVSSEPARVNLMRAVLVELGLKVNTLEQVGQVIDDTLRPNISPMYFCSEDVSGATKAAQCLLDTLSSEASSSTSDGTWKIKDSVDTFHFTYSRNDEMPLSVIPPTPPKQDSDASQSDIDIRIYPTVPSPSETPKFDLSRYFALLRQFRTAESVAMASEAMSFGSIVLYGDVVGSTQTLLEKNFKFSNALPSGFVCIGSHQVAGRGRGRNSWISQTGCLQFSFSLTHSHAPSVIFIQYLVGLALVSAIRPARPECGELPVRLKWPNDVYVEMGGTLKKVGGILVTSSYWKGEFRLVVGCGINVTNPHPTLSLTDLLPRNTSSNSPAPEPFTTEEILARFFAAFEPLYTRFIRAADRGEWAFGSVLDEYYRVWLHSDQIVTLGTHQNRRAQITGIDTSGLLKAVIIDDGDVDDSVEGGDKLYKGQVCLLQPDGNSFDMLKGLIFRKV
ncbi:biotin-protein ligase [Phlyctochytrium arcticum]|nr:biotin-protein ligase [Phlyctochytrium arcticum]